MTVNNTPNETKAEYALRTLAESLAYFSPTHDLVSGSARTKRSDNPDFPQPA